MRWKHSFQACVEQSSTAHEWTTRAVRGLCEPSGEHPAVHERTAVRRDIPPGGVVGSLQKKRSMC